MNYKILLLEDDATLNETVSEYLQDKGYSVESAYDGESAADMMYEKSYDLYLLDVKVPLQNGFDLLKAQRQEGKTVPAIFMTSLNSMDDLEKGYDSGCDDYIKKPFALKELLLRIHNILKRGYFHKNDDFVQIDKDIKYDTHNSRLIIGGVEVTLANKEHLLLKLFLQHQNQLLTHEKIYDELWGYDESFSESSLRTYIKTLRKYLGKDSIVSLKKLGYRFNS